MVYFTEKLNILNMKQRHDILFSLRVLIQFILKNINSIINSNKLLTLTNLNELD
jgi:hypothetical protein